VGYTIGDTQNQGSITFIGNQTVTNNNPNGVTIFNPMLFGNAGTGNTATLTFAGSANGTAPQNQAGDYAYNEAGTCVNGNISDGTSGGSLAVVIANNGSTQLAGSNTYSGGTTINSGSWLIVGSNTGLGTGAVNVAAGGQLTIGPSSTGGNLTVANNITLNGITTNGALVTSRNGGITNTLTGTLTLAATSNLTTTWSDKFMVLAGQVTGPGGLEVDDIPGRGGSIIDLSNPMNNFQGGLVIGGGIGGGGGASVETLANNVIPSGAGAGDVTDFGYLTIKGNTQNINALKGTGNVRSEGGSGTLVIGNNDSTGYFFGQRAIVKSRG
jgi:autotransporter-associated beta strand protein